LSNLQEGKNAIKESQDNELIAQLLGGWWALSMDALIEAAGSEIALAAFKPHIINSSRAGFLFVCKRTGWGTERIEDIGKSLALAHTFFGKDVDRLLVRDDQECLIRFSSCPFSQGPRESCLAICYYALVGAGELIGPGYIVEMPRMMKNGDQACVKWVRRRDPKPSSDPSEWKDVNYGLNDLNQGERDWFFRAYIGEMWMLAIRAFLDLYGKERTLEILTPRMRANGLSFGIQLTTEQKSIEPKEAVRMVMSALRQNFSEKTQGDHCSFEITECPFSSQSEACPLLEAFLDGVCESINHESRFHYVQKVIDGNSTCNSKILNI